VEGSMDPATAYGLLRRASEGNPGCNNFAG
jgi:hypothetical protein